MKFLIINDFRGSKYGDQYSEEFTKAVKKAVTENIGVIDTETIFYKVNKVSELKAYLYQPDIGYTNIQSGKNFNLIDVVLINGDHCYKPWESENLEVVSFHEIFTLIRMCMKSQKPLFCSGGSMLSFYFLSATDLDHVISSDQGCEHHKQEPKKEDRRLPGHSSPGSLLHAA